VFNRLVLSALADLAARLRAAPALAAKADLDLVRGLAGTGDDGAVVDAGGRLLDVMLLDDLLRPVPIPNAAVLMAGGDGRRLRLERERLPARERVERGGLLEAP
jgi:hypothetical protein